MRLFTYDYLMAPMSRYTAQCSLCDWSVADSSALVVYRAAQAHRSAHPETTP